MEQNDDLKENILLLIHDCITKNIKLYSSPKMKDIIFENVFDLLSITIFQDNLCDLVYENIDYYFETVGVERSIIPTKIEKGVKHDEMEKKILDLKNIKQPDQNTKGWFEFRWNLLSASSMWKVWGTQSSQNQLILGKCKPIKDTSRHVNINSTFHHGHKYEPLSTMLYEYLFDTEISEWGCIRHKKYDFIGASPDGINTKKGNARYGRMLEIKNIVNREITGKPKMEYWIQMQIQMEVWDLEECDFLETRFKEYESEEDFKMDGTFQKTSKDQMKGVIVCFYDDGKPIYKYAPLCVSEEQYDKWYDDCLDEHSTITWVRNIYWYLDQYSCVLVLRNREWFNGVVDDIHNCWKTILHDRVHGYDHRKPKKRKKKEEKVITISTEAFNNCKN